VSHCLLNGHNGKAFMHIDKTNTSRAQIMHNLNAKSVPFSDYLVDCKRMSFELIAIALVISHN